MRLLIAPNFALPYDQRMVRGLAAALTEAGHEAHALLGPLAETAAAEVCRRLNVDVLLQVNRLRPLDPPLPDHVRHVAWFQDVFPETNGKLQGRIRGDDIIYALGDPHVLGLNAAMPCKVGTLLTGIDALEWSAKGEDSAEDIDFSFCGFIPRPVPFTPARPRLRTDLTWYALDRIGRIPFVGSPLAVLARYLTIRGYVPLALQRTLCGVVESLYQPLRGALDIHALTEAMEKVAEPYLRGQNGAPERKRARAGTLFGDYDLRAFNANAPIASFISHLAREYPRAIDRIVLIQNALGLSDSVEIYGPGWQLYEQFKPYHRGVLGTPQELGRVYRRSRINLANNTHGLGLHQRTLECMAAGGFVLTHESANDAKPGGLLTSFEPGRHYGAFKPEAMQDSAQRWLRDEKGRRQVGADAAKVVRDKHLWRHRAAQLIADLEG